MQQSPVSILVYTHGEFQMPSILNEFFSVFWYQISWWRRGLHCKLLVRMLLQEVRPINLGTDSQNDPLLEQVGEEN